MDLLVIKQKQEYLLEFTNYLRKKHPDINIVELVTFQYIKEKFYRKRKMIIQFLLNFFHFFFDLIIFKRKKYDIILLNGILITIPYLLLIKAIPFIKPGKKIIITGFFIHKLIFNKLIQRTLKFLMDDNRIILAVQSKYDEDFYSKLLQATPAKVLYFHYCLDNVPTNDKYGKGQDYIFAGGFSNRDYECLFKAAKSIKHNFIIVCSSLNKIPFQLDNIRVLQNLDFDVFNGYLKNSKIVIIPIKHEVGASGHMLALSAMSFKKPIIYTNALCISDYFKPDITGVPYKMGDVRDLTEKIEYLLSNSQRRVELGDTAYREYREVYHSSNYYRFLVDLFYGKIGKK